MRSRNRRRRNGVILVLSAVMMVVVLALAAFAVDIGYVVLVRTELQAAADSAAMASTWDLLRSHVVLPATTVQATLDQARATARDYAGDNFAANRGSLNLADSDITIGRLDVTGSRDALSTSTDPSRFNAVQIRARRTADQNGEVSMFFARILGTNTVWGRAAAMAAYVDNFQGFKPPADGDANLPILPLALDKQSWDALLAGNTGDNWMWNDQGNHVTSGQDGVLEVNLYPQGTGSPGNRGTVDVGSPNNSTCDISRQIRYGVTARDLSYLPGGKLTFGSDGTIRLNGDTGMSAGIKDDLASIIGQTRVIPIFSNVSGNGNNAEYTIVQFAGVRILAVDMTGNPSSRYVMVQPAAMLIDNGIPAPDDTNYSQFLYSKHVWLVQ